MTDNNFTFKVVNECNKTMSKHKQMKMTAMKEAETVMGWCPGRVESRKVGRSGSAKSRELSHKQREHVHRSPSGRSGCTLETEDIVRPG
jgi:hypothetical protein